MAELVPSDGKSLSFPPRSTLTSTHPSGGMAGSLALNKRFEQAVSDLIGEDEFVLLKKKMAWDEARKTFDRHVKTAYRG